MRPWAWLLSTRILVCVALAASVALYVHYLDPADSGFCGLQSGCEAVRRSGVSYFFGSRFLSLPLASLLAYGAVLLLSLRRRRPVAPAPGGPSELWAAPELTLLATAGLGAAIALGLVVYQVLILGAYCWLCLVVDGAALLAGVTAFLWARAVRGAGVLPEGPLAGGTWIALGALAVLGPLGWGWVRPSTPIPPQIAALYQPGKINVVEFADFECPYCRRLHRVLAPLLAEYGERVAFQRVHLPLEQHPNAEHAARAALCAEAQGKGEAMADRLFTIALSPHGISAAAEALRLDPLEYDACLRSPQTDRELARHAALLPDEQFEGLPTTYIGNVRLLGAASEAALRDALERAQRPAPPSVPGPVYAGLLGVLVGGICWLGRRRRAEAA